jgi:hypothetical protein
MREWGRSKVVRRDFFKNLTPPFLRKYIIDEYINFIIELKPIL